MDKNPANWKRTFTFIWTGQLFSILTSSIVSFAIIFWLSVESGSAEVLAFATISSLLPQLVLGLFTGVLVDRWNRKRTMILADLYIASITAVMATLFAFGEVNHSLIYILLALRSIGSAFHAPAMEASVPLLAPQGELMRVAGVNNMIFSSSNIAAPALAALFISTMDMQWVLLADVLGALLACTSLLFVKIPNPWDEPDPVKETVREEEQTEFRTKSDQAIQAVQAVQAVQAAQSVQSVQSVQSEIKRFGKDLNHAIKEITRNKGLMWMLLFTVLGSLAMVPVSTLFPLMTLEHFAGDTYKMSIVEMSWGIGMLAGGGLMSIKKIPLSTVVLINAMYMLLGLTFLFSGILSADSFNIFVVLTFIGGVSGAIFWGSFTVLLQTALDPAVLGRVFSIHNSLIMIPAMFSLLATGYIADNIGITNAFILGGALLILTGAISQMIPSVRQLSKKILADK